MTQPVGLIGLGKMGANLARQLVSKGIPVVGYNRTAAVTHALEAEGIQGITQLEELTTRLTTPRMIWLMLPAGSAIDDMIVKLTPLLEAGDILIDGGNSRYTDSIRRGQELTAQGFRFIDVGVSGGPHGARTGACCMVGGDDDTFRMIEPVVQAISLPNGYQHFTGIGAGHFVKMVHNGIEYGMMQAIAEGFEILRAADYRLDLTRVTDIYSHGSVIESRLVSWLQSGYAQHGQELADVTSTVAHTGEGAWTVETAKELGINAPIIEGSLEFRKQSATQPRYAGKILAVLREQFGGHASK